MVDVGSIVIVSSDRSDETLELVGLHQPRRVLEWIEQARRVQRQRFGVHIDAT